MGTWAVLTVLVSPSTVTSTSVAVIDANGTERRIKLNEFQGFGTPDQTLSELDLPERQRRLVHLHERIQNSFGQCERLERV